MTCNMSPDAQQVLFPACLTARQRALLHEVAEDYGWTHSSAGAGDERQITICCNAEASSTTQV